MTCFEFPKSALAAAILLGLMPFGWSPSAFAAQEVSQAFTLDGRLYSNTAGTTPMEENPVELKLQILNNNQTCILYEETQNVNTSSTSGFFTIQVGSASGAGKRTAFYSARTMQSVYSNTVASIAGKLVSDGTDCTYNPSAGHLRYLRVLIKPPDNVTRVISPNMPITSVPASLVAERAESVQGYSASQLLLVNTNAPISLSQTNLEDVFSTTNFTKLQDLLDGTSTQYVSSSPGTLVDFNGQRLTDVATPTNATDATNKDYVDTRIGGAALDVSGVGLGVGGGSTLVWDQTANEWVAQAGGAGFNLVAGTGLLGGTLSSGDTISIDVGVTANKIVQLTNTGVLPALDGWLLTNLNAPVLSVAGRTGVVTLNAADITGLGTAALRNYGTAANNLVELTNDAALPAVDGYLLTNVNASRLRSYAIAATAPTDNQILTWNNTTAVWEPRSPAVAGITDLTGDLTATGPGSAAATIANSAITAAKINATGYAINRLLITDGTNPNLVTYATCTDGEILVYGPTGWLCNSMNEANAFFQGGNAFGAPATLGTTDATNLNIITNNTTRMTVTSAGNVGIGTAAPGRLLHVNGPVRLTASALPAPAAAGDIAVDSGDANKLKWYDGSTWQSAVTTNIRLSGLTAANSGNTIDNLNNAQVWSWSTASSQTPMTINANALTSGSILTLTTSNTGLNSTSGLLQVANTGTSNNGVLARFQSNSTAGSGVTVLANGNVGVGTSAPAYALDVNGIVRTSSRFYTSAAGTAAAPSVAVGSTTTGLFASGSALGFATSGTEFMRIDSTGRVGIGTTAPNATLQVAGGSIQLDNSQQIGFANGSGVADYWRIFADDLTGNSAQPSGLVIYGNGAPRMSITTAGRVGIGVSNPSDTLTVNGSIRSLAGGMVFPDGSIQTSAGTTGAGFGMSGTADLNFQADSGAAGTGAINFNIGVTQMATITNPSLGGGGMGLLTSSPQSKLDVNGNVAIGSYAGVTAAPANGLIVSGNVGIGTSNPTATLEVNGSIRPGSSTVVTAACDGTTEGMLRYNYTTHSLEICNGTVWMSIGQSVSPFSFTDQANVNISTTITSNTVTLTGFTGSLNATCNNCTAIARNGSWSGTSVVGFQSGDTIALRVLASASQSTAVTANVTVGSTTSGTWTVTTTASGPNPFNFTDVADASTNITYTSNAVTLSGFTGPVTATCNNCTGIARNGSWGVSPMSGFQSGDTIAIRLTSNAALGSPNTAFVTVGTTTSATWTVTTTNGCQVGIAAGQLCPDGTMYVGTSVDGNVPMYTTVCDSDKYWNGAACVACATGQWSGSGSTCNTTWTKTWNNGTGNWTTTGIINGNTGRSNTQALVALVDAGSPYNAANYCENLTAYGHSDWYLPAQWELNVFWTNVASITNLDTSGTQYWSSSELNTNVARTQRFSDGTQNRQQ